MAKSRLSFTGWPFHCDCCDIDPRFGCQPCYHRIDHGKTKGHQCTSFSDSLHPYFCFHSAGFHFFDQHVSQRAQR